MISDPSFTPPNPQIYSYMYPYIKALPSNFFFEKPFYLINFINTVNEIPGIFEDIQ